MLQLQLGLGLALGTENGYFIPFFTALLGERWSGLID